MEAIDKIIKAKIRIQSDNPFFAYLSLYLKIHEDTKGELPSNTLAGVSAKGELIFKKKEFENLTIEEIKGVIAHEILHLALLHLTRRKSRNPMAWNIACDIVVNKLLKDNNFILPMGCLWCENDDTIEIKSLGITIENVDKKTAEEIYDELKGQLTEENSEGEGESGEGNSGSDRFGRFDKHIEGKQSINDKKEIEDYWTGKMSEAYVSAKMKGNVPEGFERLIGKLHEQKINWKTLLQRFITSSIPIDYTYAKPNKKSVSMGYYIPDYVKEKISILVGIDLSGSIGGEELTDFMSEIIGISKTFRDRITFRILTHDVEVHNDYEVKNCNIDKIKNLKLEGGGGTSHKPIFDYIKKQKNKTEVAIFFTDGYSDLEDIKMSDYNFKKLIVLSKNSNKLNIPLSKIIKLEKEIK